jgi:hypothetical protein
MSTIASPRDASLPRRPIPQLHTPSSSTRPSIDSPRLGARSESASPSRGPATRRNRAALREYYNLKNREKEEKEEVESEWSVNEGSDVAESEMDGEGFDGEAFVRRVLETQGLGELLATYNGVLTG